MAKIKTADITGKIVDLLTPLESADRHRVVQAAFTLLGETDLNLSQQDRDGKKGKNEGESDRPPKVRLWIRQNDLTSDQLDQIFPTTPDGTEVICNVPGKNKKEKTINAYVLTGAASLLSSGERPGQCRSKRS